MIMADRDGSIRTILYRDLWRIVRGYAAALAQLGLKRGDRICILSENCPEWTEADFGAQTLGIVVVPIYPTLPADQAKYIASDCGACYAFCNGDKQIAKVAGLQGLVAMPLLGPGSLEEAAQRAVIDEDVWSKGIDAIDPEDVATIIYTSGTTGLPKGAMLPHRAFDWIVKAVANVIPFEDSDVFLSFLPISHVYERVNGQFLPIGLGITIAYVRNLATITADFKLLRPTVMLTVPRFLESVQDRIREGVRKQPPLQQKMFAWAFEQGRRKFAGRFAPFHFLTDRLVGKKIRDRFGGKFRFFISGGAALPEHVAEFYGAFGMVILQGYGLTETSSGVIVNCHGASKYWTVGKPLPGMECRLAEDGEILLRGPAIMRGYHNMPEETAATLDSEGWFRTGDIGAWEGDYLKITDRKKDILVLGNGKNVAPQPIEAKLRVSPFIDEVVVLGDGMDHCIALVVPDAGAVRGRLNLAEDAPLTDDPGVRTLIKSEIDRVNKTLANFEYVKKFALLPRPFSIEEGELTPSLKVKRKVVREKYADVIAGIRGGSPEH
jgi:long-chain acyl-CoA synthetase